MLLANILKFKCFLKFIDAVWSYIRPSQIIRTTYMFSDVHLSSTKYPHRETYSVLSIKSALCKNSIYCTVAVLVLGVDTNLWGH